MIEWFANLILFPFLVASTTKSVEQYILFVLLLLRTNPAGRGKTEKHGKSRSEEKVVGFNSRRRGKTGKLWKSSSDEKIGEF